jgi:hypothetical protein
MVPKPDEEKKPGLREEVVRLQEENDALRKANIAGSLFDPKDTVRDILRVLTDRSFSFSKARDVSRELAKWVREQEKAHKGNAPLIPAGPVVKVVEKVHDLGTFVPKTKKAAKKGTSTAA